MCGCDKWDPVVVTVCIHGDDPDCVQSERNGNIRWQQGTFALQRPQPSAMGLVFALFITVANQYTTKCTTCLYIVWNVLYHMTYQYTCKSDLCNKIVKISSCAQKVIFR